MYELYKKYNMTKYYYVTEIILFNSIVRNFQNCNRSETFVEI